MNVAAGPRLAAAVTNAGGLGVIGGVSTSLDLPLQPFLTDTPRSGIHQTCYGSRLQNSRATSMTRALLSVLISCKFRLRPTNAGSIHLASRARLQSFEPSR